MKTKMGQGSYKRVLLLIDRLIDEEYLSVEQIKEICGVNDRAAYYLIEKTLEANSDLGMLDFERTEAGIMLKLS